MGLKFLIKEFLTTSTQRLNFSGSWLLLLSPRRLMTLATRRTRLTRDHVSVLVTNFLTPMTDPNYGSVAPATQTTRTPISPSAASSSARRARSAVEAVTKVYCYA